MRTTRLQPKLPALLFGLAPGGVYPATDVATSAVRSYRTISPLPAKAGGIFSVALSVGLRLPGVTWHLALWSPDFPPFVKTATIQPTLVAYDNVPPQSVQAIYINYELLD